MHPTDPLALNNDFAFRGALLCIGLGLFAGALICLELGRRFITHAYNYVAAGRHRRRRQRNFSHSTRVRINAQKALTRSAATTAFVNHNRVAREQAGPCAEHT